MTISANSFLIQGLVIPARHSSQEKISICSLFDSVATWFICDILSDFRLKARVEPFFTCEIIPQAYYALDVTYGQSLQVLYKGAYRVKPARAFMSLIIYLFLFLLSSIPAFATNTDILEAREDVVRVICEGVDDCLSVQLL